jgi:thiamine phosphate phosphatase / amino-HMP aminohydrolase
MFRTTKRASKGLPAFVQPSRAPARPHSTMTAKPTFNPTQPIHWILDWDGTITRRDTLDALVSIAASSKPDSLVLEEWKRVSEAYMTDHASALAELAPGDKLPTTVKEEKELLQALASVEQASLNRVSASQIFAGLTQKLLEEGANAVIESKKVEIRSGFDKFLRFNQAHSNDSLDLLSVNWSRHFINSCLSAARTPIDKASIYANELDSIDSNRISHGEIGPAGNAGMLIMSSGDKLEYMAQLREQSCESSNTSTHCNRPIIYVGDSWTDIECLEELLLFLHGCR